MIVGLNMSGSSECIFTTPILMNEINKVEIKNGVYDYLFGSNNSEKKEMDWDYDTAFYAKFKNNLMAGNVDYAASMVSSVRIKRRRKDIEHKWFTVHEFPINKNEDFSFEFFDRYTQGDQDYDYAFVPVINNIEGNISQNSIRSEFSNYFILDKDVSYPIVFNTELNLQLNQQVNIVNTLGSKYPFVISNSISQYKTGTLTFGLAKMKDCNIDLNKAYDYRDGFEKWIMNGKPKIIKDLTGHIYMVQITSSISVDVKFWQLPTYEIQFTEVGNALDEIDMYYNDFINVMPTLSYQLVR